jgi:hypothetical protein
MEAGALALYAEVRLDLICVVEERPDEAEEHEEKDDENP